MTEVIDGEAVIGKFKDELEEMREQAQPGDTMPAGVFFMFMDTLIPAFDQIIEENTKLKEELSGSKQTTD